MLFLGLLLGFLLGCSAGLMLAAWMSVVSDQKAVADGVIKLCGKLFVLKEIDL
jgi:hypothetical protein